MDKLIKTVDAIYSKYWRKDNIETYAVAAKKLLQKKQKAMTAVLDVAQEMEQIQKANVLEEEKRTHTQSTNSVQSMTEEESEETIKLGLIKTTCLNKVFHCFLIN